MSQFIFLTSSFFLVKDTILGTEDEGYKNTGAVKIKANTEQSWAPAAMKQ
jgi:hypothetical protein